jgi:pyruvate formate lyase activating enzyme
MTVAEVLKEIEKDTVFYDESGGGATFSGGEPFKQSAFLKTLLASCKEQKIHTAVETCGFVDPDSLISTSKYVDLFLYDLKIMQDERHKKFTGASNKVILANLRELARTHDNVIVRFPVIPEVNDDEDNVSQLGAFVSSLRNVREVDVLPYHKFGIDKYRSLGMPYRMTEATPPSGEDVTRITETIASYGPSVKVGGWNCE